MSTDELTGPWQIQIETDGKVWCFTYRDAEQAAGVMDLFVNFREAETIQFRDDIGSAIMYPKEAKMVRLVNVGASAVTSKEAADLHNAIYPPPKSFIEVLNPFSGASDEDDEPPSGIN